MNQILVTTQDLAQLPDAIAQIRAFLRSTHETAPLELGDVVRIRLDGPTGVVVGMTAPGEPDADWSYLVCIPDTDDPPETVSEWYDSHQLDFIKREI